MASARDVERSVDSEPTWHTTFELERFEWGTPERLEVVGSFAGLGEPPSAAPELVVHGASGSNRLPVIPESIPEPPVDGSRWRAEFAWTTPPVPVASVQLVFGDDLVIELPVPGARRPLFRNRTLEVRRPGGGEHQAAGGDLPHSGATAGGEGAERLRLQVELTAAREEVRELRARVEAAAQDVARAREDLEAEQRRHAGDADRFREELERLRRSADEALAEEQASAKEIASELQEARGALQDSERELQALRDRAAALESAAGETERLRSELAESHERAAAIEAERDTARSIADEVRAEARGLAERVESVRKALGED